MKRIIAVVLCALMLTACFVPAASAEYSEKTVYFEDGSYLEVSENKIYTPPSDGAFNETIGDDEDASEESSFSSFFSRIVSWLKGIIKSLSRTKTVTKTKYANYYSSKGEALWSVCLTADFSYNGRSAVCNSSSISYTIVDKDWTMLACSSYEQDNIAAANYLMKQRKLGVPLKEIEGELTLTCDKNGNVK